MPQRSAALLDWNLPWFYWARTVAIAMMVASTQVLDKISTPILSVSPAVIAPLLIAMALTIALRRWFPRSAAIGSIVLGFIAFPLGMFFAGIIPVLVTAFSVASRTDRRTALIVGVAASGALTISAFLFLPEPFRDIRGFLQLVAFIGFATAAGDAARSRREFIESMMERTRKAEETKEAEAQRRVAEERLAIARDLHDVLAHQIAVINLNANVASQAIRDRPDDAEMSLATIRQAARNVLSEIGQVLTVLRAGDRDEPTSTAPVRGMDDLDRMLIDFAVGGLKVDVRSAGAPAVLSGSIDIVAYRVIQEALTNAQKHGADGSALLSLDYQEGELEIIVTNTITSPHGRDPSVRGHGLTGVEERVSSVGGTMETTFGPGPVHRLSTWLPLTSTEPAR